MLPLSVSLVGNPSLFEYQVVALESQYVIMYSERGGCGMHAGFLVAVLQPSSLARGYLSELVSTYADRKYYNVEAAACLGCGKL